ncbi:MAG: hypothetical protein SX243_24515 [Acidobacteriota bacterium]|nr:hypothetical protein [Acidobacteriota bacterium]
MIPRALAVVPHSCCSLSAPGLVGRWLMALLLAGSLTLGLASPAAAMPVPGPAEESGGEEAAALDPVVQDVVSMLERGVGEALVVRWLESSAPESGALSAEDLIALTEAGASEELIGQLLDRGTSPASERGTEMEATPAAQEPAAPAPPLVPAAASTPPPAAPPAPAAPSAKAQPPATQPPVAPAPGVAAGQARVEFEMLYAPVVGEDEEAWDLYVYLDGAVLAWVPASTLLRGDPMSFQRTLPAGRHVLRLLLERHERSGKSYRHYARVEPRQWVLEVGEGAGWQARLDVKESRFRPFADGDMEVSWQVLRGGEVTHNAEHRSEAPGGWAPLCEEVETFFDSDGRVPLAFRSEMKQCVRWQALWPEDLEAPSRTEVRQRLAQYDYRPKPLDAR